MAQVRPFAPEIQIDSDSLSQRIQIISQTGTTRLAYSPEDIRGRAVVIKMMRDVGLNITIDAAGNIVGCRPGRKQLPPLAFGSHVDTVRDGGRYDGILGVMAAIECVRSLRDAAYTTEHPIEVIVFANEEGQRFGALCGSRALVGALDSDDLARTDEDGRTLSEAIQEIGGDPAQLRAAMRKAGDITAYVELHIEQGGTLEKAKTPIGIVEGISGISHTDVRITGRAAHAGTTTMEIRKDALVAASELVLSVREAALESGCHVATVGQLTVMPNGINIIPGEVSLTIEVRDIEMDKIKATLGHLRQRGKEIACRYGVQMDFSPRSTIESVPCSPLMQDVIAQSCMDLGLGFLKLPSGAGHDAQMMAKLAPMGMIFVPSQDGISHSPREFTSSDHCSKGAQVLLRTILHLDEALSAPARSEA
jgi:beta-ureidopropionase / N-carbamoyl-L-amino-acid hydrolase